jgi:uncharacterized membrane protein YdcZ (DUF606 family)
MFISMLNFVMAGSCETLDCAIEHLLPHMNAVEELIGTIAYIVGLVFIYKAIIKFKEHNESKGQVKISIAILYFIAGGLLLGLPAVINMGQSTISINTTYDNNNSSNNSNSY